ncbi:MAG: RNA polymerase sigma-70 factor [Anaerolineae bacterium]|nr:RNA polymerase sigma-70 factor [Anaerolineae bacterium]
MGKTESFIEYQRHLFAIAYRMLGSAMDAEEMVQETYLRWQADPTLPSSPKAYLSTIVTRLCIDHLRAAHTRNEHYVGEWLPEPLLTEGQPDLTEQVELADSLSLAFGVILRSLSPTERAAYLLREVFDYDYAEVAHILQTSEANCRQMVSRAKSHLQQRRPRFDVPPAQRDKLFFEFSQACQSGDLNRLLHVLAADAVVRSDGGGKAKAALNAVHGADKVARFMLGLMKQMTPDMRIRVAEVNGQRAVLLLNNGQLFSAITFDYTPTYIREIDIVVNPDKLRSLAQALG